MTKPATALAATLAILALAGCGQQGGGAQEDPIHDYVKWYSLPDGSAAVQCYTDASGASCDWGHVKLKDQA